LANQASYPRHIPQLRIDAEAITGRLQVLAGTRAREISEVQLTDAVADIARLLIEVTCLHHALIGTRLEKANLEAAIRAALGAREDGDYDPIGYLRDEITPDHGGAYGS
jgi:hypothetical protein